jgi:transcriptional regulator with GAF, ATPase, and Fis domain
VLREEHLSEAQQLVEPFSVAFENDHRLQELARMREALEADRRALLSRLERQDITDTVVGEAAGLRSVMERVEQVAPTDAPVLILGETGSGKEVIARSIHARSRRAAGPVVRVNCGAIPPQLIDSELFGHERGSFTGAVGTRKGWFERADGGTLFLDEIAELPLEAQVRLLRVLQDGSLERVGGHQAITVDVRIVAATHRNLETMVAEGRFREDLWYRISIFPIRLPALRERPQDIPALVGHFAHRAGLRLGGTALTPSDHDVQLLSSYPWPGNVRELAAVIERAAILGNGRRLEVAKALGNFSLDSNIVRPLTLPPAAAPTNGTQASPPAPLRATGSGEVAPLDAAMVSHIERALSATHGRIEGPFGAARILGVNPHTLRARMRKLGIEWSRFRNGKDGLSH